MIGCPLSLLLAAIVEIEEKGRVLEILVEQSLERTICENGMEKISLRREGSDIAT